MASNSYHVWTCNRPYTWNSADTARIVNGTSHSNAAREAIETIAQPYRKGALVAISGPLARMHAREYTVYYACTMARGLNFSPLWRRVSLQVITAEEFVDDRTPTDAELCARQEPAVRVRRRMGNAVAKDVPQEPPGSPQSEAQPQNAAQHCMIGLEHATAGVAAHERITCPSPAEWQVKADTLPGQETPPRLRVCHAHLADMLVRLGGERHFRVRPIVCTSNGCDHCGWRTATRMHVSFLGKHIGSLCETCIYEMTKLWDTAPDNDQPLQR